VNMPVYLDYNATTPHDPEVIEAMKPFLDNEFGNPSSTHFYGIEPKRAVNRARAQVASLLNCSANEIIFTGCATESNNHAIKGAALSRKEQGNHIIISSIEHHAVLEVCRHLAGNAFEITVLPVHTRGLVEVEDVEKAIKSSTILISIMHANNEVGTIQPIEEIADLARNGGILMHTDAAQSLGKIPVDVGRLGVDLLSMAGHKIYAPKGIGALYVREGIDLSPFLHGASQEGGMRAGTENVLGIVAMGKACEIAGRDLDANMDHMKRMRDLLQKGLFDELEGIRLNGDEQLRLPNTLNISFEGLEANRLLEEIGLEVAVSAGAACHSDIVEISHVLEAMHIPVQWAKGTLRLSTGRFTTQAEILQATGVIVDAVKRLRENG